MESAIGSAAITPYNHLNNAGCTNRKRGAETFFPHKNSVGSRGKGGMASKRCDSKTEKARQEETSYVLGLGTYRN